MFGKKEFALTSLKNICQCVANIPIQQQIKEGLTFGIVIELMGFDHMRTSIVLGLNVLYMYCLLASDRSWILILEEEYKNFTKNLGKNE